MPGSAVPAGNWLAKLHVDKLVHAFLFGVFLVLLVHGFRRQQRWLDLRTHAMLAALCIAVSYGVFTELLQEITNLGRRGDMKDMLANTVGCLIALLIIRHRTRSAEHGRSTSAA